LIKADTASGWACIAGAAGQVSIFLAMLLQARSIIITISVLIESGGASRRDYQGLSNTRPSMVYFADTICPGDTNG